jgi:beta-lactamase class A
MIVRKADLSVGHQPLANLIGKGGYHTTLRDLLFRMIVDSDNAATDLLFARLGGPANVQSTLDHKRIPGFQIDKNERELGSSEEEVVGRSQTNHNTAHLWP